MYKLMQEDVTATFKGSDVSNKNLIGLSIFDADESNQTYRNINFTAVQFAHSKFVGCTFENCAFDQSIYQDVEFIDCTFINCLFSNSKNFLSTKFIGCQFTDTIFKCVYFLTGEISLIKDKPPFFIDCIFMRGFNFDVDKQYTISCVFGAK